MSCEHEELRATVTVVRYAEYQQEGEDRRMAEIEIVCTKCGRPFRFEGVPGGLSPSAPRVDFLGTELRAPIVPADTGTH